MIIDAHCHAGPGDGFSGPWDSQAPLGRYLARCDTAGITHSNVFAAFHSDYTAANEAVGRIIAARPGRLSGFAFVHAERDRGRIQPMLRDAITRWGMCGVKVHRHDARISREICTAAARLHLPVLYDVVGEVATVDLLASTFPGVDFIIPHLGSFGDDWSAQTALIPILAGRPNVYTDTSGVRRFDVLLEAVRRAGARKVLFGSDGPWLHPGLELAKIRALHLPPAATKLILSGNFRRLTAGAVRQRADSARGPTAG